MRASLLLVLAFVGSPVVAGCEDPCATGPEPTVEIGKLVGTAGFEPFANGDEVTLGFAPQGGSGVNAALRTVGMSAHETLVIFARSVHAHLVVDGLDTNGSPEVLGDFTLDPNAYCVDGDFGLVTDAIFGLDPSRYDMPETVDGRAVTLHIDLEDENGAGASDEVDVVFAAAP